MKRLGLQGQRVVVTRARHQAEELAGPLRELGAEPLLVPMIGIGLPDDPAALQAAAERVNEYDWLIFTSVNAVTAFVAELADTGEWFRPRVAAIGPATQEVAENYGFRVEVMPAEYVAESLVEAFRPFPMDGKRILLPSAAETRDVVPGALRERGALVDVVAAYCNVIPAEAPALAAQVFQDPMPDWVTFASSSAVRHLAALVAPDVIARVKTASIGPATSATLRQLDLPVTVEAAGHTIPGLIESLQAERRTVFGHRRA